MAFSAQAHSFEERYELPVPLDYVVAGACATVFLSFLVAVLFVRQSKSVFLPSCPHANISFETPTSSLNPPFINRFLNGSVYLLRCFSFLIFVLTIVSALWGSGDPLMNLAPTLIWIVWWIGLSFLVMLFGDFWPAIDPWRHMFDVLDVCARKLGASQGISLGKSWPARLGVWPAVFFLLLWCWLEVVYPIATSPLRLGYAALAWCVVNLTGMICFGQKTWQRHADVFALYFSMLGRMSPLQFNARWPSVWVKPKGTALIDAKSVWTVSHAGFVMAMLSTVLFDGLHGGTAWVVLEQGLKKISPHLMDVNGYFAGTVGLAAVWLVFLMAYLFTCRITASLVPPLTSRASGLEIAARLAPTLIPIAGAYNIAHNFSNLLIQGQTFFQLMSDPLGLQWDLFGTARLYPDISIVDAKLTWCVAVAAIVIGHVVSVWLSHRATLHLRLSASRTAVVTIPLTALMLVYTAISLSVIAEPMVSYAPELTPASVR